MNFTEENVKNNMPIQSEHYPCWVRTNRCKWAFIYIIWSVGFFIFGAYIGIEIDSNNAASIMIGGLTSYICASLVLYVLKKCISKDYDKYKALRRVNNHMTCCQAFQKTTSWGMLKGIGATILYLGICYAIGVGFGYLGHHPLQYSLIVAGGIAVAAGLVILLICGICVACVGWFETQQQQQQQQQQDYETYYIDNNNAVDVVDEVNE